MPTRSARRSKAERPAAARRARHGRPRRASSPTSGRSCSAPLEPAGAARSRTLDVDIDLGDRRLTGTVGDVFGNNLVAVSFSNLGAKHRLAAWINALALAAGLARRELDGPHDRQAPLRRPGRDDPAARRARRAGVAARPRRPLRRRPARAAAAAGQDVAGVGRGVPPRAGGSDGDPERKAAAEWETPRFNDSGFPKEDADAWHVRAFGEHADYDLLAAPLRAGEDGPAPHRLGPLRLAAVESADRRRLAATSRSGGSGMETFDITARPRARHHPARGERRHRQDLDHRRARHQARRRRRGRASTRCWWSPSPAPPARSCASACARQLDEAVQVLADPASREPGQPAARLAARRRRRRAGPSALRPAHRRPGLLRRRDHRDHPPVLPARAAQPRRRRRHRLPARPSSRTSSS